MRSDNKRIAKNTIYLYGRQLLTIGISLYTVRVVLNTLGIENYGIYNVVGGIVAIFGFLNGSMTGATSRFLNFELGTGNKDKLCRTFSTALTIHFALSVLILIIGETAGLYYVNNYLEIAPERMTAAVWTYQLSLIASVFTIVQIPYTASVMAHENMNVFALVSLLNVILKLIVAVSLTLFSMSDTLVAYAALMTLTSVVVFTIYVVYCRSHYDETFELLKPRKDIFKNMLSFSGWDIYGNLAYTARFQGILLLLNRFGGTVLNAAGGLTVQVSGTLTSFVGSIVAAFRPQIVQKYARQEYDEMLVLLTNCAKYCLLLMALFSIPLIIEMEYLLGLWLEEIPPYSAVFCRLAIIAGLGELLVSVCTAGIHATGKVLRLSLVSGTMYLLELPIIWLLYDHFGNPSLVYIVHIVMIGLILLADTSILHVEFRLFKPIVFLKQGVLVPLTLIIFVWFVSYISSLKLEDGFIRLIIVTSVSSITLLTLSYYFVLDREMRKAVAKRLKSKMLRR